MQWARTMTASSLCSRNQHVSFHACLRMPTKGWDRKQTNCHLSQPIRSTTTQCCSYSSAWLHVRAHHVQLWAFQECLASMTRYDDVGSHTIMLTTKTTIVMLQKLAECCSAELTGSYLRTNVTYYLKSCLRDEATYFLEVRQYIIQMDPLW